MLVLSTGVALRGEASGVVNDPAALRVFALEGPQSLPMPLEAMTDACRAEAPLGCIYTPPVMCYSRQAVADFPQIFSFNASAHPVIGPSGATLASNWNSFLRSSWQTSWASAGLPAEESYLFKFWSGCFGRTQSEYQVGTLSPEYNCRDFVSADLETLALAPWVDSFSTHPTRCNQAYRALCLCVS